MENPRYDAPDFQGYSLWLDVYRISHLAEGIARAGDTAVYDAKTRSIMSNLARISAEARALAAHHMNREREVLKDKAKLARHVPQSYRLQAEIPEHLLSLVAAQVERAKIEAKNKPEQNTQPALFEL